MTKLKRTIALISAAAMCCSLARPRTDIQSGRFEVISNSTVVSPKSIASWISMPG